MKLKLPKNKALIWGAVIIGGGIVIMSLISRTNTSGGGAVQTTTGPSENLQLANLQSQTQLAMQQMQTGAELQALAYQGEVQTALATQALQAEIALAGIDRANQTDAISAQLAGLTAQLDSNLALAQTQAQTQAQEIEANRAIQMQTLASNAAMFNTSMTVALEQSRMQNETIQFQTAAQTQLWQNAQELDAIEAQYLRDIELARIDSQTTLGLDENATERYGIGQSGKTQRRGQTLGFVGSIIGAGLSLFSDVRLKEDIEQIGETPDGLPLYSYYSGGSRQVGVMAQEMAILRPEAVGFEGDYLTVDYQQVA